MIGARMPGFTAEESLGILFQEYQLTQVENDEIGIITTQAHEYESGLIMMPQNKYCCDKEGNCGCVCPRDGTCAPCSAPDCQCWCE